MLAAGLALDALVYHRVLRYQPGWAALPLGALELGLVLLSMRAAGVAAPLGAAVVLFAGGWIVAQLLGHVGFPLLRLGYAEEGGELGRLGVVGVAVVAAAFAAAGATAYAQLPPVVHLAAGVHAGPLVIDRREVLVGAPGAVVRGGIVVRANDVTIRKVGVVGGDNGITVAGYRRVVLDHVRVSGAKLDGIHVRSGSVSIHDCVVDMLGRPFGQGIDISYTMGYGMSMVDGCTVVGGMDGIVTHVTMSEIAHNHVSRTGMRALSMTEMSMGKIENNTVTNAHGLGILCNDRSICEIERNTVVGTRAVPGVTSTGWGVLVTFFSEAKLRDNALAANPRSAGAIDHSIIESR
jgi:parallel beta-helix repeat protein